MQPTPPGSETRWVAAFDAGQPDRALLDALQAEVSYAFQPIVNIHSGNVFGFEALLRGHEALGWPSIQALLDHCFEGESGEQIDALLCAKALERFTRFSADTDTRLFFNMDGRVLGRPGFSMQAVTDRLTRFGVPPCCFCIEVSDRTTDLASEPMMTLLTPSPGGILIAIDDFGTGHPGLQMLSQNPPDFIKIDRNFIGGIEQAPRKKLFLSTIVGLAQSMGVHTIVEGVETEAEFRICREVGFDLLQGHFVAHPTTDPGQLRSTYEIVPARNREERRLRRDASSLIRSEMDPARALTIGSEMNLVFDIFRQDRTRTLIPVVDDFGGPVGLLHEHDLKEFIYSPFGKELIANRGTRFKLRHFVKRCLSFDINTPVERILSGYAAHAEAPAVLIADDGKYVGVLQASALLRLMNDQQLAQARSQNPLTRLPGNLTINDYFFHAFDDLSTDWAFAYFDFDHFKPFNDAFGFRQGDRAILMFADLLRRSFPEKEAFIAHIGGDDFFVGFHRPHHTEFVARVQEVLEGFARDAISFYDPQTQRAGYVEGLGRDGRIDRFPLLRASCAIVFLPVGVRAATPDSVVVELAALKKQAKQSTTRSAIWTAG